MSSQPQATEPEHPYASLARSFGTEDKRPKNQSGIGPMGRRFLREFAGTLWLDPVLAAERAGYSKPPEDAKRLLAKFEKIIERQKMQLYTWQIMSAQEAKMILSAHGRGQVPMTATQIKAIELMLRVHGLLSDKVDVNLPGSDLEMAVLRLTQQSARPQLEPSKAVSLPAHSDTE